MTGLLHRLAARATGTAWTVRSDARLAFGAGQLLDGEAVQDSFSSTPASEAPMDTAPLVTNRHAPPAAIVQAPAMRRPQASATQTPPAGPTPLQAPSRPVLTGVEPFAAVPQQPHGTYPTAEEMQPSATTRSTPMPQAATHTAAGDVRAGSAPQPAHALPQRNAPEPLLPPARAAAPAPGKLPAQSRMAAGRSWAGAVAPMAASQDTEVHIHIGRIDVTAVHEAPRPKARTRERAEPVSLEAYLATRNAK